MKKNIIIGILTFFLCISLVLNIFLLENKLCLCSSHLLGLTPTQSVMTMQTEHTLENQLTFPL